MFEKTLTIAAITLATLALTVAPAAAHDDHSHDECEDIPPPPPPLPPTSTQFDQNLELDYNPTLQILAASTGSVLGAGAGAAVGGLTTYAMCSGFLCGFVSAAGMLSGGIMGSYMGSFGGLLLAGPKDMTQEGLAGASTGVMVGATAGIFGILGTMKLSEDYPQHDWIPLTGLVLSTASVGLGTAVGYQLGHDAHIERLSISPFQTRDHTGLSLGGTF